MLRFAKKLYYSIKYRRVLSAMKEPQQSTEIESKTISHKTESGGDSNAASWIIAIILMIPSAIGCGFGVVHYRISTRLADQMAVDQHGVDVDAVIQSLELETITHEGIGPDRRDSQSKYCVIAIEYSVPQSDQRLSKMFRLEDDSLCERYNVGDSIPAKMLPDAPEVVVLNEGRLAESWFWISLVLCGGFLAIPLLAVLRIIQVSLRNSSVAQQ